MLDAQQGGWQTVGPSAIPQLDGEVAPQELDATGLERIKQAFVKAAQRSQALGIEAIEIHNAHGYLLHQFLSPIANQRSDQYGGSLENRMRYPLEVFQALRSAFSGVLGVRVSASDWLDNGLQLEEVIEFAKQLKALGCDFIHVSSGGISPKQQIAIGPNYQVPFAKAIKAATGMTTIAVGLITEAKQAEAILQADEADAIAMARAFLYQPRWVWQAAAELGGQVAASEQYWRCMPRQAQHIFGQVKLGQR